MVKISLNETNLITGFDFYDYNSDHKFTLNKLDGNHPMHQADHQQ